MMNSIRFYPLASLRHKGEAQNRKPTRETAFMDPQERDPKNRARKVTEPP
jgi:hypothetical protein